MVITIVGLGLIGGCYAKALKKEGRTIYGVDIDDIALSYALREKIIDKAFKEPKEAIKESDLVIISLYPNLIIDFIRENREYFKKDSVITDVTGIKESFLEELEGILPNNIDFIPAHPMAGIEKSGVYYAETKIFRGANFIITPLERNKKENVELVKELALEMGFRRVSILTPKEHDEIIAYTSQLTHAIAVSLVNSDDEDSDTDSFIGDSYRDLTRIAKINENMWSQLFLGNKEHLVEKIDAFQKSLDELKEAVKTEDSDKLKELFISSTKRREAIS